MNSTYKAGNTAIGLLLAGTLVAGITMTATAAAGTTKKAATAGTPQCCTIVANEKSTASATTALQRFRRTKVEMAIPITVILYAANADAANAAAEAVFDNFRRLNATFSDYDKSSELRRLCATAGSGEAVPVSDSLWAVLTAAVRLARDSNGAFDPTIGPVVRLWRRARRRGEMPNAEKLAQARQLVDYRLIELDCRKKTVRLIKPGMRIDLGGIAKGYALDQSVKLLQELGINRALIDAGGDIVLADPPPGKQGWTIGIAQIDPETPPERYLCLARTAIATSGDTWQHVQIDRRRYSHLIDPRTGLGLTDHNIVTVIAPTAMAADGLASALSVLGPKAGMKLIEAMPGTQAFIRRPAARPPAEPRRDEPARRPSA